MQRLGAAAWTGDIRSTWKVLAETPTSLLNWSLAGMPYGACDIGGYDGAEPSPEMLARWMEAGVFFPVMRSHSAFERIPRFPWLFGPEAESAIRKAIELRYRLIPYYYSLAHETCTTGVPLMRPLVMEFPGDGKVANLSDQWLMGSSLMAAPVLQAGGKRSVYLPAGTWYAFDMNCALQGNQTLNVTAALDEIPVYVKAGTILPLGSVIQHTGEQPGGPLELQIYPGKDATFTLVEDDGETTGYLRGQTRRTTFKWNDASGRLSWKTEGDYAGKEVFKSLRVVLFDPKGRKQTESPLTAEGAVLAERLGTPTR
jgi:alpha-glucosidase